jgi:UDP-N-acetylmuramoyl-L-alanyl-D-glutamate--2,6-diaminopimelate ligase
MGQSGEQPAALVMEVSSHALELNRVGGLSYDCAVWTNLTQDHLDFHHTMSEYYQAKKRLFTHYLKSKGKAVINIDDTWGARLARELTGIDIVTYGAGHDASVRIANWRCGWDGSEADVIARGEIVHLRSRLIGLFNVYNMAALCAGAVALSIDMERVRATLGDFDSVAGRMEKVPLDAGISVVVDYAHTPDALENVLATARDLTRGRLFCVFGCGGDRDRTKRPRMAEAAVRHCDEIIITSDNPRTEKPGDIIEQILEGVPLDFPHWVIADRRAAIAKALGLARPGDCVIIAGKGHETYQEINGVKHHFSDREVVEEEWRAGHKAPAGVTA